MNILALADLHAEEDLLDRLRMRAAAKRYDAVLFCGDITTKGPVSYAEDALSLFPRTLAVFGNMDTPQVADRMSQLGVLVHGMKVPLGNWNLVGLGGSNPTPFRTPHEFSEQQISGLLESAGVDRRTILLSHPPPFGIFDTVEGKHTGSTAVRKCMDEKKPLMVLCGHIHEHEGKEIVGETLVVKLPAAQKLRAAEIEINGDIKIGFIDL